MFLASKHQWSDVASTEFSDKASPSLQYLKIMAQSSLYRMNWDVVSSKSNDLF